MRVLGVRCWRRKEAQASIVQVRPAGVGGSAEWVEEKYRSRSLADYLTPGTSGAAASGRCRRVR